VAGQHHAEAVLASRRVSVNLKGMTEKPTSSGAPRLLVGLAIEPARPAVPPLAAHCVAAQGVRRWYNAREMGLEAGLQLPAVVDETLRAYVTGLRRRFGQRLVSIRLFGSYARGNATADSDVDCLILLDRVDRADDRAVTDLAADLVWQIGGVVISPLAMSAADFEVWKARERRTPLEIERDGIAL
jgi:uncharacterized protein